MPLKIADRLAGARAARFVARKAELDLFGAALAADPPPFTVLHVHGPGGVGKTTLLAEFARLARGANRTVAALDARDIQVSRQALTAAIEHALGRRAEKSVVLIDTYEALAPLDTWLRRGTTRRLPLRWRSWIGTDRYGAAKGSCTSAGGCTRSRTRQSPRPST